MADSDSQLDITPQDRDIAIRTMIGEENAPDGMAGVASVLLNRAQSGKYGGNSLSSVAFAPNQFDSWDNPQKLLSIPTTDPAYLRAAKIFDGVASGEIPDLTNGSTNFYAPKLQAARGEAPPSWASGQPVGLGSTLFFAPNGQQSYKPPAAQAIESATTAPAPQAAATAPAVGAQAPDIIQQFMAAPSTKAAPARAAPTPSVAPDIIQQFMAPAAPGANDPNKVMMGGAVLDRRDLAIPPASANVPTGQEGFDRTAPVGQQLQEAGREAANYVGSQLAGIPGAVANDFSSGVGLAERGANNLVNGNVLPSFPSSDPRTWSAGGALQTLGGASSALFSPLTGAVQQLVEQPVTDATGSPEIGQRAGLVANMLSAPLVGPAAKAATLGVGSRIVGDVSPETAQLADMARNQYGIPINAGQMSESPAVRFGASALNRLPFSGAGKEAATQQTAFNRAVSNTFGEDAPKITPAVMQAAKTRLGNEFNTVAANTTIQADPQFAADLTKTFNDAQSVLPNAEIKPIQNQIKNIYQTIDPQTGQISGESYQALTRQGSPLNRAMNSADPNVKYYAGQVKDALDDAMQRSASPDMAARLTAARTQYKAMKTVEDLVEKSPNGDISPAALMTPVRNSYGNMAYNGGGDLGNLARIGQKFKEPPSSGTAERLGTSNLLSQAGAVGTGLLGLHEVAPSLFSSIPENAGVAAASIPISLGVGRLASAALRSKALAGNVINRSLGVPTPILTPVSVPANLLTSGGAGLAAGNKFVNAPASPNQ